MTIEEAIRRIVNQMTFCHDQIEKHRHTAEKRYWEGKAEAFRYALQLLRDMGGEQHDD